MKKLLILTAILALPLLGTACRMQQDTPQPADADKPAVTEPATTEPDATEPAVIGPVVTGEPKAAPEKREAVFAGISTTDIYGNEVDESIFTDYELTMLNIWATYCNPCIMEMPYLGEMSAEMPQGTQIVGVAADALTEQYLDLAKNIVEETGANFTHLLPDEKLVSYMYNNVVGVPTTVFVDSQGNLVGQQLVGAQPRSVYEDELASRLEQVRAAAAADGGNQ